MGKLSFREFVNQTETDEEERDIQKTLSKLPHQQAALVNGFKWKFHAGNTLDGDDQHVGYMDDGEKEIAVAAPWRYSREFTTLHEVGHKVWERLPENLRQHWAQLAEKVKRQPGFSFGKEAMNQQPEELFCMAYAAAYSEHPPVTFYHPEWVKFIKNLA